jgi:Protein of unknown function (DUF2599)
MHRLLVAAASAIVIAASFCSFTAGPARADPVNEGPPFIADAQWAHWGDLTSLRVYPTQAGRDESLIPGTTAQAAEAWGEVLALSPEAASPGMREQFMCHWSYAETAEPGKTSWNLEPWRPAVDQQQMIAASCNPGGTEEPF